HFGAGKGAPLIVLHGAATATEAETAPLIRTLASRFRTVGLDLPGHGKSAYPPASLSIRDFSDEIHDAILALSSEPVHIVGVSMGAAIGLEICRQQAHSVRSLTMIAPTDAWTRQRVQRMRRRLSIDRIIRNPFMVERLSVIHGDHWAELFNDLDRLIESLEGSEYAADELRNVDTPTLIVAWDRDPLFGIEPALRLANEIPYSRLCVLPGSNHSLSSRSAWRLGAFIDDFLSEC
ncbi:MAG: alpha/beta fold hydrolase, partial [Rhodothermales bacterium]